MKRKFRLVVLLFAFGVLVRVSSAQVPESALRLTANEAKHTIEKMLLAVDRSGRENNAFSNFFKDLEPLQAIAVSTKGFSYLDRGQTAGWSWKPYSATRSFNYVDLKYVSVSKNCPKSKGSGRFWCLSPQITAAGSDPKLTWSTEEQTQLFADALNRLIYEYSPEKVAADKKELENFPALAAAWQKAGAIEALPEEVRRLKTLAENYIQEKEFDKAIQKYEEGLAIYPTWPTGHFNVALLYGELGQYSNAVKHMTEYLMLVPNAPDAGPARDKIEFWRDKAKP